LEANVLFCPSTVVLIEAVSIVNQFGRGQR
jgi:hypothetical protein